MPAPLSPGVDDFLPEGPPTAACPEKAELKHEDHADRIRAPAGRARKTERTGGAGASQAFKDQIDDSPSAAPAATAGAVPLAALSSLLAIQEAPDPTVGRRKAVLRGDSLLDELKELQVGLVQGWVSEGQLRNLARMLDQPRPAIDDPDLKRVLDDIELRAAVELAKLERSSPR
ncbi:MAG: flagellar assembly protein FliX [Rhizobiales bacterium]|nr:flagellar assembly protein FliX [Hyphomicrobiales bacterium]